MFYAEIRCRSTKSAEDPPENRPSLAARHIEWMGRKLSSVLVSDVLNDEKKQQAIALGRLGWSLRQIQQPIGVRRETRMLEVTGA